MICFYAPVLRMKIIRNWIATAGFLAALGGIASAQTNSVTVTNYVTVTVTNVVIITNAVPAPISITAPVVVAPNKVKYAWNNTVSAGLTLARGNSDFTLVTAGYNAIKKTPVNEYDIDVKGAYGEQSSVPNVDNYEGSLQWNHLFTDRVYGYLRGDGLHDYIANVDYRITIGPGLGYYLLKETNLTLSVEGGVSDEEQSLGDGTAENFATLRAADKFEYKINGHARFWQNFEILPEVDRWDNYVANFEIGAETSFTKSWSLKTYLDDNYNNRPALEHLKNDVKLVAGVAYKF